MHVNFYGNNPLRDGSVHLDPASTINVQASEFDPFLLDFDWGDKSGVALR